MLYLFGATGIHPAAELKVVVKKKSFLFPSLSSAMHYSTSTIAHNNDIHTHTHTTLPFLKTAHLKLFHSSKCMAIPTIE